MPNTETLAAAVAPVIAAIEANIPTVATGWYAVNLLKDSNEAEITIYDAIGEGGVSADRFVRDLKGIRASTINVRINTPGGSFFDGAAIYNALRAHPSRVVVHIDGVAASAGSFVAMSGDEVRMADNAFLMIHNSRAGVMGQSGELRRVAGMLDGVNDNIAAMYERKTGKSRDHWRNLMDAETWFTATEAKAEGLVDAVYTASKKTATVKAEFDFTVYNKIPDPVREMWGLTPPAAPVQPQVNLAPEDSPTLVEPPPAVPTETHVMAELATPTQAPPAQNPAAGNIGIPQGTYATVQEAIDNFKSIQGPQFFEQGRKKGAEEAVAAFRERITAIAEACPGKPEMALNAIRTGQSPDAVALAFNATQAAENKARTEADAKDMQIVRLEALLATGGHPGVAMAMGGADDAMPKREPKAQAEWEWDNQPVVRKTAKTKEIYVLARTAELDGTHRSFSRETANV